jgi:hypothetical protein
VYPDPEVAGFITQNFIPDRAHIKEQQDVFARFGAEWTPTVLIVEPDGTERHRFEGFLPKDDFLAQLRIGLAHASRSRGDFTGAERHYRELIDTAPDDVAAEALYWAGVSKYKATNDGNALAETAKAFQSRFTDTPWAKKSSVWK